MLTIIITTNNSIVVRNIFSVIENQQRIKQSLVSFLTSKETNYHRKEVNQSQVRRNNERRTCWRREGNDWPRAIGHLDRDLYSISMDLAVSFRSCRHSPRGILLPRTIMYPSRYYIIPLLDNMLLAFNENTMIPFCLDSHHFLAVYCFH